MKSPMFLYAYRNTHGLLANAHRNVNRDPLVSARLTVATSVNRQHQDAPTISCEYGGSHQAADPGTNHDDIVAFIDLTAQPAAAYF